LVTLFSGSITCNSFNEIVPEPNILVTVIATDENQKTDESVVIFTVTDIPTTLPGRPAFDQASYETELTMEHHDIVDCVVVNAGGTGVITYNIDFVEPTSMKPYFVITDPETGMNSSSI
jgi:hypothetical protein